MTTDTIKWGVAHCPECGRAYKYVVGGYRPATCNHKECVHKHLHPELGGKNAGNK